MKQLFINNKRVVIEESTYFPFTHKVSDLQDVSIIGLPVSKSVTIPRCAVNDEIFGNIAEINRVALNNGENKIGVSFNQIQKTNYSS